MATVHRSTGVAFRVETSPTTRPTRPSGAAQAPAKEAREWSRVVEKIRKIVLDTAGRGGQGVPKDPMMAPELHKHAAHSSQGFVK